MSSDPADSRARESAQTEDFESGPGPEGQVSEQELRAAYEAEMQRVTSAEMMLQATVSLLNIGGYRLGLGAPAAGGEAGQDAGEPTRDLEQVRDAIDAVRALLPIIERRHPQELRPLRDALSQLQMAYAREAGAQPPPQRAGAEAQPGRAGGEAGQQPAPSAPAADRAPGTRQPKPQEPGPAEASGRLWVPGR